MKTIDFEEEFSIAGQVWCFQKTETGMKLIHLRKKGGRQSIAIPTVDEVVKFFEEKGYPSQLGREFHEYYEAGDWKDKNGTPVKKWKQKALSVWMKPERKVQPKKKDTNSQYLF